MDFYVEGILHPMHWGVDMSLSRTRAAIPPAPLRSSRLSWSALAC